LVVVSLQMQDDRKRGDEKITELPPVITFFEYVLGNNVLYAIPTKCLMEGGG